MSSTAGHPHPPERFRIVLLSRDAASLSGDLPTRGRWFTATGVVGGGAPVPEGARIVEQPAVPVGGRARLSRAVHRTSSLARTTLRGAPPAWTWAIAQDQTVRGLIQDADAVVPLDMPSLRALRVLRDRLGAPVVRGPSLLYVLRGLEEVFDLLTGEQLDDDRIRVAAAALRDIDPDDVPDAMVPTVVDVAREVRRTHGQVAEARALVEVLDRPAWSTGPRTTSGLAARRLAADLTLGSVSAEQLDEEEARRVTLATLGSADEALAAGRPGRALDLLGDAMALLFHRARHAEVLRSPLVDDPVGYLAPLRGSRTLRALLARRDDPTGEDDHQGREDQQDRVDPESHDDEQGRGAGAVAPGAAADLPRVLVVTGSYGDFHRPVVGALQGHADVKIREYGRRLPHLGRNMLDPDVLPALASLLAGEEGRRRLGRVRPARQERAVLHEMRQMITWADVVLSDWADRTTVWVSHLCPPGTRLVVRVHALDALDPWFHLVRWERVEEVVVVSEPMRSLVTDLLLASGVSTPVVLIDNLVPLGDLERPKTHDARTTLGMVGWGRVVKDAQWTLDLLERDPSWRLVLVGAPPPDSPTPSTRSYVEQMLERLGSPALRDRVEVVGATDDVAGALARVGVIVSASRRESWHLGLVEGVASGAVPVVRDWPLMAGRGGPRTLFPDEWVVDDLDAAEARVRAATRDPAVWEEQRSRAQRQAHDLFDPEVVAARYRELLIGSARPGAADPTGAPAVSSS